MRYIFAIILFLLLASCNEGIYLTGDTPVKKYSEDYGSALAIGKLVKISEEGWAVSIYELIVSLGATGKDHLGQQANFSTDSKDAFNKLQKLDKSKIYVFNTKISNLFNLEIEDSDYQVIDVTKTSNDTFKYKGVRIDRRVKGREYNVDVRKGKIIQVRRWGKLSIDCTMQLVPVGIKVSRKSSIYMNIYSEEGCSFAEKVLRNNRAVEVEYSEDFLEFWSKYRNIAHKITLQN